MAALDFSITVPINSTFTYVFIPAEMEFPIQERVDDASGGLESDNLMNGLRAGTELGPNVDITALTLPTKASDFVAVSVYINGNAAKLPVNRRIMGLLEAAGVRPQDEIRGPAVVSRYFDNDDAWHRIDIKSIECVSDADWVRASLACNKGRKTSGNSLSGILKQQATQMGMGGNNPNGEPVVVDGRSGGAYDAEAQTAGGAEDPCDWIQTGDEIELTFPLPSEVTKKEVRVAFKTESLALSFEGHPESAGVKGMLGGKIVLDGCTWTVGDGNIVITMEKKDSSKQWLFALQKS